MKESIRALLNSIPEEKRQLRGREAIAYLATLMRRIPREDYDHNNYFTTAVSSDGDLCGFIRCGTAACAAGWGAAVFEGSPDPWHDRSNIAGFYNIEYKDSESIFSTTAYHTPPSPRTVEKRIRAVLKGYK